jgi:hypothetical protein
MRRLRNHMGPESKCTKILCWQSLLATTLPPEEQRRCEQHIESCPDCQSSLELAVQEARPLLALARQVGDPTLRPADPDVARFMQRLQVMGTSGRRTTSETPEAPDLYFLAPSDRPELLGQLGGYEVHEVIGQGGMGIVLRAFEPMLHRQVAIKVIAAALAGSATARRRFIREAQAAAAVCHDHIVAVHGVHESNGLLYLVMQFIDGDSLQARIDRTGPLDVADIVRIGLQTAAALAAAHAQGVIHRDIKPANILLENGLARVKITDFGLARMADDARLTQNGVVVGTPEYMAPEQARGEPLDHRADLFSLGSVLYAMATGDPPFRGETTVAVLRRVSDDAPMAIRVLNPDVPAWLEALIGRLQAKDPGERFQTAAEVAALLEGYLAHLRQPTRVSPPQFTPLATQAVAGRGGIRRLLGRRGLFILAAATAAALVVMFRFGWRGPSRIEHLVATVQLEAPAVRPINGRPGVIRHHLIGHTGPVHNVLFTPDGRLVSASGWPEGDGTLRVWDTSKGLELMRIPLGAQAQALDLSADGRFALVGLNDGKLLYIDLDEQKLVWSSHGHKWIVSWVGFAPDGKNAFSCAIDNTARQWNLSDGQEVGRMEGPNKWVRAGAISPDGLRLLTGDNSGVVRIWDVEIGLEIKQIERRKGWINALATTADGRNVLIADREVSLYDLETGLPIRSFAGHADEVQHIALAPDGRRMLTASYDGNVRLWDFATGRLLQVLGRHDGFVFSVAFSPDGQNAASAGGGHRNGKDYRAGSDFDIRLWDLTAAPAP